MVWWWLWAACELIDPPVEAVVLDEARLLGLVLEPPEVGPGEIVQLTPWVVDPRDEGYEMIVWTCTPLGGGETPGCLEELLGVAPWTLRVEEPRDGPVSWGFEVPSKAAELLTLVEHVEVPLYTLVCALDRCPIIARTAAAPDWPDPAWDTIYDALSDPSALVSGLGFDGVHLSVRSLPLSRGLEPETRNTNPTLTVSSFVPPSTLSAGETVELSFRVGDRQGGAMVAYGFATEGRITPSERVRFNEVTLFYEAPSIPTADASARIWIIVEEDYGGGSVVYTQAWTVP